MINMFVRVLNKKLANFKQKIGKIDITRILIIFGVCLMTLTIVSALWNPWSWDNDPSNNTQQDGKLFIIEGEPEWNVLKVTGNESKLNIGEKNAYWNLFKNNTI